MVLSMTVSDADAVAPVRKGISMKALQVLARVAGLSVALFLASPMAEAQRPPPPGGGGSMPGGVPPGGSFRGGPPPGGGSVQRVSGSRSNIVVGVGVPGAWWGPGVWRGGAWGPGPWRGGWWGPGVWWGPGAWPGGWWAPGVWPGTAWGPNVWVAPPSPPIVVTQPAPVFIERSAPVEPPTPVWWFWCEQARAYFPYVKECPGGWQQVAPQTARPADLR